MPSGFRADVWSNPVSAFLKQKVLKEREREREREKKKKCENVEYPNYSTFTPYTSVEVIFYSFEDKLMGPIFTVRLSMFPQPGDKGGWYAV